MACHIKCILDLGFTLRVSESSATENLSDEILLKEIP